MLRHSLVIVITDNVVPELVVLYMYMQGSSKPCTKGWAAFWASHPGPWLNFISMPYSLSIYKTVHFDQIFRKLDKKKNQISCEVFMEWLINIYSLIISKYFYTIDFIKTTRLVFQGNNGPFSALTLKKGQAHQNLTNSYPPSKDMFLSLQVWKNPLDYSGNTMQRRKCHAQANGNGILAKNKQRGWCGGDKMSLFLTEIMTSFFSNLQKYPTQYPSALKS